MKPTIAFIHLSIFSYLACLFLAITGKPPIENLSITGQVVDYLIAMGLLMACLILNRPVVRSLGGAVYGFFGMYTFAGNVHWAGGVMAWLAMAIWDLGLGFTLFSMAQVHVRTDHGSNSPLKLLFS